MSRCFAYPCSVDSGVTDKEMLRYIKTLYNNGNKVYAKKKIIEVIPELKGVDVFAKGWDEDKLENSFQESEIGKYFHKVGTVPIDSTMMGQDYDMFIDFLKCLPLSSHFINDDRYTHIQDISSFLQREPNEKEVRILCIIGHGISEEQAKLLKENPPAFDNDQCTDSSKMESCRWKWPLINCNDRDGLGKGYTARSVCENAKKGDVVVFASGFLTPEWIVEQLRKRELKKVNGKIPFTLVLLVDSCYSGEWTKRIADLLEHGKLNYTRLVVQTSCAADEGSYGQCFIPYWCAMQNENERDEEKWEYSDETQNCKQTPTLYDSDHKDGDGVGLKFFTRGQSLQYKFNYTVNRGAHKDFINTFSHGDGTIHSYKLKHYKKDGTPMAFFLVEIDRRMIHLHVHFRVENTCAYCTEHNCTYIKYTYIVTAINSFETIKLTADEYMYDEVVGTKKKNITKGFLKELGVDAKHM